MDGGMNISVILVIDSCAETLESTCVVGASKSDITNSGILIGRLSGK
jgi:hypothetical protein